MTQHTGLIDRLRYEPTASQYLSLADLIASLHEDRKNAANALEAQAREIAGLQAARMAYASEFPLDGEGEPDVGSIHQNIRAMKAEIERLRKDAALVAARERERCANHIEDCEAPIAVHGARVEIGLTTRIAYANSIRALNTEGEGNDRP